MFFTFHMGLIEVTGGGGGGGEGGEGVGWNEKIPGETGEGGCHIYLVKLGGIEKIPGETGHKNLGDSNENVPH